PRNALPRSGCAKVRAGVLGGHGALPDVSAVCRGARDYGFWAFSYARLEYGGFRDAGDHRFLRDFRLLHSHPIYWRQETGGGPVLRAAVHADPNSGGGGAVCLPAVRTKAALLGRALDFVGISAVESALRRNILRGLSATALSPANRRVDGAAFRLVCRGHCDGFEPSTRSGLASLWTAGHGHDSAAGVAARRATGGASGHAPGADLDGAHL